jgi:hypothetical protein
MNGGRPICDHRWHLRGFKIFQDRLTSSALGESVRKEVVLEPLAFRHLQHQGQRVVGGYMQETLLFGLSRSIMRPYFVPYPCSNCRSSTNQSCGQESESAPPSVGSRSGKDISGSQPAQSVQSKNGKQSFSAKPNQS